MSISVHNGQKICIDIDACQKGRMSERPHVQSISQVTFFNMNLSSRVLTFIYLVALMINNFTSQSNKTGAFFTDLENDDTETRHSLPMSPFINMAIKNMANVGLWPG